MTSDPSPLDVVSDPSTTDPLSEVTRQERKALLGSCVIAVSIAAGGLVPGEIDALGITVTPAQEKSLLYILASVLTYFVVGFAIYALSDLKRRQVATAQARRRVAPAIDEAMRQYKEVEGQLSSAEGFEAVMADERFKRVAAISDQVKLAQKVSSIGTLRIIFDIWVPIIVGLASIALVISATRGFPGWQWAAAILLTGTVVGLAVAGWRQRKLIRRWRSRYRSKWLNWRFRRLKAAADKLPDGHPKKAKLLEKVKDTLMKSLNEFASGTK